jgi:hypothetical protein
LELQKRTFEVFNLFNPAFCGLVIAAVIEAYEDESDRPFPFPVVYLILPVLLSKELRDSLPTAIRQPMHTWIQKNPKVRVGFPDRCRDLLSISHEAVTFLLQTKRITLTNKCEVSIGNKLRTKQADVSEEILQILKKAALLGKWFASSGSPSTIFTIWGVRP